MEYQLSQQLRFIYYLHLLLCSSTRLQDLFCRCAVSIQDRLWPAVSKPETIQILARLRITETVFFRDGLDFLLQYPELSLLVRRVITSNCGKLLGQQSSGARDVLLKTERRYPRIFSAKCISEHNGLST